jgi:hypothetical protein
LRKADRLVWFCGQAKLVVIGGRDMSDLIKRKPLLRLLARESYPSSLQHAAVLAVVAITVLIAIVPFAFAIIAAVAPAGIK